MVVNKSAPAALSTNTTTGGINLTGSLNSANSRRFLSLKSLVNTACTVRAGTASAAGEGIAPTEGSETATAPSLVMLTATVSGQCLGTTQQMINTRGSLGVNTPAPSRKEGGCLAVNGRGAQDKAGAVVQLGAHKVSLPTQAARQQFVTLIQNSSVDPIQIQLNNRCSAVTTVLTRTGATTRSG